MLGGECPVSATVIACGRGRHRQIMNDCDQLKPQTNSLPCHRMVDYFWMIIFGSFN